MNRNLGATQVATNTTDAPLMEICTNGVEKKMATRVEILVQPPL